LVSACILLFADASPSADPRTTSSHTPDRSETSASIALSGLPVDFVENRGQWAGPAAFVARQGRMAASLEPGAVKVHLAGEAMRTGRYNFFVGDDPRKWQSNVPAFGAVRYRGLYDGIDLRVLQREGRIEYDVLLAPGADLEQVVIRAEGASEMKVDTDGTLVLETAAGPLRQTAQATWEELPDGTTRRLDSR